MHFGDWKGISMAGVEQRFLIFFTSLDTTVSGPACASETPISWYMYMSLWKCFEFWLTSWEAQVWPSRENLA